MVLKKAFAISLAILIFSWNLSITLSTHFCGGKAVKSAFSIATADLECGMMDMSVCDDNDWDFNLIQATPCCENQHSFFKITDRYQNFDGIEIGSIPISIAKAFTHLILLDAQSFPKTFFNSYKPPLPKQATLVLFQVFRL